MMNEKILIDIVEQADENCELAMVPADTLIKFAELIVRRVISVYNDTETFKTSTYDDKRVLEYFGIEE